MWHCIIMSYQYNIGENFAKEVKEQCKRCTLIATQLKLLTYTV